MLQNYLYYPPKPNSRQMTNEYNLWVLIAEINSFSQLSRNYKIPHMQYYLDNDEILQSGKIPYRAITLLWYTKIGHHHQNFEHP